MHKITLTKKKNGLLYSLMTCFLESKTGKPVHKSIIYKIQRGQNR